MHGFIKSNVAPDAGGRKHSQRTADDGSFVGQDVAEQVLRQHDVKSRWRGDHLHRERIDVGMIEFHIRILLRDLG